MYFGQVKTLHALHISISLSHPHTCSDGLVCDEPFCEVMYVSLHMFVITQDGDSPLMGAVKEGRTEVVSLLVKAGATLDPSWKKASSEALMKILGSEMLIYQVSRLWCKQLFLNFYDRV